MEMEAAGTFCSIWQSGPSLSCVSQIFPWSPGMGDGSGLFFDVSCSKNWKNFQNLHFNPTFSSISDAFMDTSSLSVSLSLLAMMPTQGVWGSVPSSCNAACCGCTTQFYKQNGNTKIPKEWMHQKGCLSSCMTQKGQTIFFWNFPEIFSSRVYASRGRFWEVMHFWFQVKLVF